MEDNRRFKTAWDVAKWIEANVPDWKQQGHADPMEAALWWWAAQQVEVLRDMSGREMIGFIRDGSTATHPDDITSDIAARYEDLKNDELTETTEVERNTTIDAEIEDSLKDFWFDLRGER